MSNLKFPNQAKLISLVQERNINKKSYVSKWLFPPVDAECSFAYLDHDKITADDYKSIEAEVKGCANVKSINLSGIAMIKDTTEYEGLQYPLCDSCNTACDPQLKKLFKNEKKAIKTIQDRLDISKELRAINLAFDVTKYTAVSTGDAPEDANLVGGFVYNFISKHATGITDAAVPVRDYFDGLAMADDLKVNQATMSNKTFIYLKRHKDFLKGGCSVDPMATMDQVAELLNVKKICISDASYDIAASGLPSNFQSFLGNSILFTRNVELAGPDDVRRTFGFTAVTEGWSSRKFHDPAKGMKGTDIISLGRREKLIVADYKSAALVTNLY